MTLTIESAKVTEISDFGSITIEFVSKLIMHANGTSGSIGFTVYCYDSDGIQVSNQSVYFNGSDGERIKEECVFGHLEPGKTYTLKIKKS